LIKNCDRNRWKKHEFRNKQDPEKSAILKFLELRIIRIKNEDIEFDIIRVLEKLSMQLDSQNQDNR